MFHDFVRGQSVAKTCFSHWGYPEYTPSLFLQCDSHSSNLRLSPAWISVHALEGIGLYYIVYRAYIPSLGTQCVQCIRTVTVPPTRGYRILDFTNLCADLDLGVDLQCPSGGGGVGMHPTYPPPRLRPC